MRALPNMTIVAPARRRRDEAVDGADARLAGPDLYPPRQGVRPDRQPARARIQDRPGVVMREAAGPGPRVLVVATGVATTRALAPPRRWHRGASSRDHAHAYGEAARHRGAGRPRREAASSSRSRSTRSSAVSAVPSSSPSRKCPARCRRSSASASPTCSPRITAARTTICWRSGSTRS